MSTHKTFRKPKSGPPGFLAKIYHLREWARAQDSGALSLVSSTISQHWFASAARRLLLSKTSTAFSLATEDETSRSYSRRWMNSGMVWRGECLTANISESPSHAAESMLLPCIETQRVPDKYFLSPNAAVGILRRVKVMGRNLPASFKQSLEILAKARS
jgi:hypothetical protein